MGCVSHCGLAHRKESTVRVTQLRGALYHMVRYDYADVVGRDGPNIYMIAEIPGTLNSATVPGTPQFRHRIPGTPARIPGIPEFRGHPNSGDTEFRGHYEFREHYTN